MGTVVRFALDARDGRGAEAAGGRCVTVQEIQQGVLNESFGRLTPAAGIAELQKCSTRSMVTA